MASPSRSLRLLLLCACLFLFISLSFGHGGVDDGHEEATGDAKSPDLHRSNLLKSKGGAIVVFFLVPFIGCWLPWAFRFNELFFKLGLLFSAGLFVSLSIEHLLADSFSSFGSLSKSNYPFAGMIAVAGYMLAWLADITAHSIWHRVEESKTGSVPIKDLESTAPFEHEHLSTMNKFSIAQSDLSLIDLLLLLFALCFHAFFEGLAVGLAGSVYDVWQTSISIILHKFFEGLALGASIKLQDDNVSIFLFALYAIAFSITAPVGIAVGIILNRTVSYKSLEWTEAIGNSFAAGVFIFVSLTHLMSRGFKPNKGDGRFIPFLKWSFAFLGAVVYSLIQLKES